MNMRPYNKDQLEAILMVRRFLSGLPTGRFNRLKRRLKSYVRFRKEVAEFQRQHFSELCTRTCFTSHTSACCGREGIATFFADIAINLSLSGEQEIDLLIHALTHDPGDFNCVYLGKNGCLWHLKPIVCEMFLCQKAKVSLLKKDGVVRSEWEGLLRREKRYTWPSRPVLFDKLEEIFMDAGLDSPLMYFHHSPGLLRVKARSGKGAKNRPRSRSRSGAIP